VDFIGLGCTEWRTKNRPVVS